MRLDLHYFSFISYIFKINSIRTLLQRAYSVLSSFQYFHKEIVVLRDYFLANSYPLFIFENIISIFLNNIFGQKIVD